MKPWELLATATTPDGGRLELQRHDGDYAIHADGNVLMTSGAHSSEDAMMRFAVPRPAADACILIGGLGMGFTLAATLDLLPPGGTAVVSEIIAEVVEWNRGPLGPLAGHPLDDPRTHLVVGDVADVIRNSKSRFDAVLLDVDNSVDSFSLKRNAWLYSINGLNTAFAALQPKGVLAIWSSDSEPVFAKRLRKAGFEVDEVRVRARKGSKGGAHHVVWIAMRNYNA